MTGPIEGNTMTTIMDSLTAQNLPVGTRVRIVRHVNNRYGTEGKEGVVSATLGRRTRTLGLQIEAAGEGGVEHWAEVSEAQVLAFPVGHIIRTPEVAALLPDRSRVRIVDHPEHFLIGREGVISHRPVEALRPLGLSVRQTNGSPLSQAEAVEVLAPPNDTVIAEPEKVEDPMVPVELLRDQVSGSSHRGQAQTLLNELVRTDTTPVVHDRGAHMTQRWAVHAEDGTRLAAFIDEGDARAYAATKTVPGPERTEVPLSEVRAKIAEGAQRYSWCGDERTVLRRIEEAVAPKPDPLAGLVIETVEQGTDSGYIRISKPGAPGVRASLVIRNGAVQVTIEGSRSIPVRVINTAANKVM